MIKDTQEIFKYMELVKEHPRNLSKRFQKDISSRTGDIPILYLSNFNKEVSHVTD